ncbi:hypothetical protein C8R44DRAFT_747798 [Mycena epipterygia]|nr:hypothetical protein C8R44DRAFT_747798 [Mycena epipterygia]
MTEYFISEHMACFFVDFPFRRPFKPTERNYSLCLSIGCVCRAGSTEAAAFPLQSAETFFSADLTTVDATSLATQHDARGRRERRARPFRPHISAAAAAIATSLLPLPFRPVGKIKYKVLKLTGEVEHIKIKSRPLGFSHPHQTHGCING